MTKAVVLVSVMGVACGWLIAKVIRMEKERLSFDKYGYKRWEPKRCGNGEFCSGDCKNCFFTDPAADEEE